MDEETAEETPESSVKIIFPNGLHTTSCAMQLSTIDTVQLEIAGHFLLRVAEDQYRQTNPNVKSKGIIQAPPGFRV